jgi:hypothetical protein
MLLLGLLWATLGSTGLMAQAAKPAPVVAKSSASSASLRLEQRFAELRKNPPELYAFLLKMPKGADLHNHFSGAVYAESYLRAAAQDGLCVDSKTFAITGAPCGADRTEAKLAEANNSLRTAVIESLSMRNFVPGPQSAHDHFFATFARFGPYLPPHRAEFLAEVIERAAAQNESYLELMAIGGGSLNPMGTRVGFDGDFESARQKLVTAGIGQSVQVLREVVDQLERDRIRGLGCDRTPESAACKVTVRYVYQVTRESAPEQVFAQVMGGFMLAEADPRVVAINFVQPEDGYVSMRDYHLHMRMVDYAHKLFPKVHITLHAGELAAGLVPPEGLRFHIREAVELGHAERIGHGVDILYETGAQELLASMRQRGVMVEINLTSNDVILGVKGKDHPLPAYRKAGVPVALSTDDEGVSRSHLTQEYTRAALDYGLTYADLKDLSRNSLEYSFAPGGSYWLGHDFGRPAKACAAPKSATCRAFLDANEKARIQADLEARFKEFENGFAPNQAGR